LNTQVGAPAAHFELPKERYNRKTMRSMGRVSVLACRARRRMRCGELKVIR
jgi:3-oxoacyl-[acyl-carrier-protein] synthase II